MKTDSSRKVSLILQDLATAIDAIIEAEAGERVAFSLIVFTEGRASYVSSASSEDMRRELTKLTDYWREGMSDIPAHEVN